MKYIVGIKEIHYSHRAVSACKRCNAFVKIDTNPLLNDIDISGEAMALGCKD